MKINKINIFSFVLMFINIFLSLPILILNIYRKKESIFLISLFLAILGFYFIPATEGYDIANYYKIFDNQSLQENMSNYHNDFYAEYLIKFLIYMNLPKNFLAFTSAFISYYFLLKSYTIVINKNNISKISYIFLFFFTYISIPIIGYTGVRFLPATAIFTFAVLNKKKWIRLFFPIVSILIHSSFLLCTFLFYFCIFFCRKKRRLYIFFIIFSFILGILLNEKVILEIIRKINELDVIYISPGTYISGKWGAGFIESRGSYISKVTNYIFWGLKILLLVYSNILFYRIKFNQKNFVLNNFILSLSCFCLIFYRYFTIFDRFSNVIIVIIYFIFIPKYLIKKYKYNILGSLFFIYFFLSLLYDLKRYYLCFYISYSNLIKISIFNILVKVLENYFYI